MLVTQSGKSQKAIVAIAILKFYKCVGLQNLGWDHYKHFQHIILHNSHNGLVIYAL